MAKVPEALAAAQSHCQAGQSDCQAGQPQQADEICGQILRIDSQHCGYADAQFDLGSLYAGQGRLEEAIDCFRRALQVRPDDASAHYNLGVAFGLLERFEEAVAAYRSAVKARPNYTIAHNNLADALQKRENFEEAIEHYQRAIKLDPQFVDPLYNLANLYREQEEFDKAIEGYQQVVRISPDHTQARNNLGNLLLRKGNVLLLKQEYEEAVDAFCRALAINPRLAEAAINQNQALQELGRVAEAIEAGRKALPSCPDSPKLHHNLGTALRMNGEMDAAGECFRRAVELDPDFAEAHSNLGIILHTKGKKDEAIACFHRAIELDPANADAHNNLGVARGMGENAKKKDLDEGVACYRRTLEFNPDCIEAHYNLGNVLLRQEKLDEAKACYERTIELDPDCIAAHNDLATILYEHGDLDGARYHYEYALRLNPEYHANWNYALYQLLQGDFENGWKNYEWRWETEARERDFAHPEWDGSPLAGKRILVFAEQGVGDEIMFAQCLPEIIDQAAECLVECNPRLVPLFARSFPKAKVLARPIDTMLDESGCLPGIDLQAALDSLPRYLRANLDAFPQPESYLHPNAQLREKWQSRFAELGAGLKVGISWRGGNKKATRRVRSSTLDRWADLFAVEGVHFINLQYGDCRQEIEDAHESLGVRIHDWEDADPLKDMDNFAAQISALDLVISIDNSTVHMAGSLGIPTWVLLPTPPDWRWMLDREDTPWYPSLRLLRQPQPGEWAPVFRRAANELKGLSRDTSDNQATVDPRARTAAISDSDREKAKYEKIWNIEDYRTASQGECVLDNIPLIEKLRKHSVSTILDAGCGSGKLIRRFILEYGNEFDVRGFDIASNCLDPFFRDIQDEILKVGCLWDPHDFCDEYDAIICTDVMEHIPTEYVPAVLSNFRRCTRKLCYLVIALTPDNFGPHVLGQPLHLTVKEPEWWMAAFLEAGFKIEFLGVNRMKTGENAWLQAFLV